MFNCFNDVSTILGTVHGKGSYFSSTSSYAARFSSANEHGFKFVIQAAVVVGEFCAGKQEMVLAPYKGSTTDQYDSVVDDVNNPTKFVVFEDTMAYPEYVIKFQ